MLVVEISATNACAAGTTAAAPIPSIARNRTNSHGSRVVTKSSVAPAYSAVPPTIIGLRPILSLSLPAGTKKTSTAA